MFTFPVKGTSPKTWKGAKTRNFSRRDDSSNDFTGSASTDKEKLLESHTGCSRFIIGAWSWTYMRYHDIIVWMIYIRNRFCTFNILDCTFGTAGADVHRSATVLFNKFLGFQGNIFKLKKNQKGKRQKKYIVPGAKWNFPKSGGCWVGALWLARWRGRPSQTGLQSRVHPDDENEDDDIAYKLLFWITCNDDYSHWKKINV